MISPDSEVLACYGLLYLPSPHKALSSPSYFLSWRVSVATEEGSGRSLMSSWRNCQSSQSQGGFALLEKF
jgi:hypothetical protein